MQITLNDDETRTLHNVLHDYLPELRRQLAATDLPARELRHELQQRVSLCERMLRDVEQSGIAAARQVH